MNCSRGGPGTRAEPRRGPDQRAVECVARGADRLRPQQRHRRNRRSSTDSGTPSRAAFRSIAGEARAAPPAKLPGHRARGSAVASAPGPAPVGLWLRTLPSLDPCRARSNRPTVTFFDRRVGATRGEWGVALQSKFVADRSRGALGASGQSVCSPRAMSDGSQGPKGLELLRKGLSAPEVVAPTEQGVQPDHDDIQIGVVDGKGRAAAFRGFTGVPSSGRATWSETGMRAGEHPVLGRGRPRDGADLRPPPAIFPSGCSRRWSRASAKGYDLEIVAALCSCGRNNAFAGASTTGSTCGSTTAPAR